jgi:hypothetical protein
MQRWKRLPVVAGGACLVWGAACARQANPKESIMNEDQTATVERIVDDMESAFARKDADGLVALFSPDATVESYLVTRIFNRKDGVCRGQAEIRELVGALVKRGVPWGGHGPPLVRGNTAAIEYWSKKSEDQKFSVDILEVKDGKIQSLRAYAGWRPLAAAGTPE